MSKTEHTPGPWELIKMVGEFEIYDSKGYCIGAVYDVNGNKENKHNADLIASAPNLYQQNAELLLALEELVSWSAHFPQAMNDDLLKAKNAINKAKQ